MATIAVTVPASRASTVKVSLLYLYLLRAAYLLLIVGLGTSVWPALLAHTSWPLTLSPWRALPPWLNHSAIDADMAATTQGCLMAVVFLFVIPWRYVFENFVQQRGERWR